MRAHHGSIAREQRLLIEEQLKDGRLPALVATSSLELGIDMGSVDLVIQVESPGSVARGLQRIGRAGHQVGEPSKGVIFPKYRGDLLECAIVVRKMLDGEIEPTVIPRNPLDVLAQQLVAAAAERKWQADDLYALVRRAENFADLGRDSFEATLGMLAGHYPGDEFAELRPRVIWDRAAGTVETRRDARTVAVISGGTIPDRGLFGVYLVDDGDRRRLAGAKTRARSSRGGGRRVGELDEEMVYEAREGEVILLGASAWRIEQITHDRVLVSPAPGEPGKIPFWKGDGPGRPVELGRSLGEFTRTIAEEAADGSRGREARRRSACATTTSWTSWPRATCSTTWPRSWRSTGALPTDRTIVLQRFRDELGDWRICLLTPFGARVHAPWALAIEARLREKLGLDVQPIWSDDGIVIRLPMTDELGGDGLGAAVAATASGGWWWRCGRGGGSGPHRVGRGRGAGHRRPRWIGALLQPLPRERRAGAAAAAPPRRPAARRCGRCASARRSCSSVASRYGTFPIILETYRECLQDVFDLPALRGILAAIERREIRLVSVETRRASPFASSLMFDYIASYMYEGDAPLVDRRAQALALDRDLLRELLGAEELRELLDADALAELELELQFLTADRRRRLRRPGARPAAPPGRPARRRGCGARARPGRACPRSRRRGVARGARRGPARRPGSHPRRGALDRDGGRGPLPRRAGRRCRRSACRRRSSTPSVDALTGLLTRWARHHGPFLAAEPAARWGLPVGDIEAELERLLAAGTLLRGEFRPDGVEREWCHPDVLRLLRRRSLARLRREIEPVEPRALARFLPRWQGIGERRDGHRPTGRGDRPARGHAAAGQRPGARRPAGARRRLLAAAARRAGCRGRGRLGRPRLAGPGRRPCRSLPA